MIQAHLENVLTYREHRITNATIEGLNSKMQAVQKNAYGCRNHEHMEFTIYFHCG
jgi:transposase